MSKQREFVNAFISLPFDDSAAVTFGVVRAQLAASGTPIGAYDLQIAAIALANNFTLVTHNVREFSSALKHTFTHNHKIFLSPPQIHITIASASPDIIKATKKPNKKLTGRTTP